MSHQPAGPADGAADDRRALGAEGEARAARYLVRRGYRIASRNVRLDGVEVDLVAVRGSLVAIVEVKTRRSRRFGPPQAAVDPAKQARLVRAAAAWLRAHGRGVRRLRFDVIACHAPARPGQEWRIEHLEGAFEAGDV